MSMSVLTLVNKVLRKLRENTILSITDNDYAEQITDMLSETNRNVEDAWDWETLVSNKTVSTVASQAEYSITGSPEGSKIEYVYDQTNDRFLTFDPARVTEGLRKASPDEGDPAYYRYSGTDSNGNMTIELFPVPNTSSDTIIVRGKFTKGDLVYTSPSTNMLAVPWMPLYLGTYAKAVAERGEDDGETQGEIESKFTKSLGQAIEVENGRQGERHTLWEVE